ncbi:MAG: UDP-3-O-acyl-N-acetylglucosamine deacetylase [Hyphomicrobiaceae bacterium]
MSSTTDIELEATLAEPFEEAGIGLHTGRHAVVRVKPAEAGSGITFRRIRDGQVQDPIRASWLNRQHARLCTALKASDGPPIRTIEHLMASFSAFRIDNAEIDVTGDELPIFDGSAVRWCHSILKAGIVAQNAPRRVLKILKPVEVREESGHFLRVEPAGNGGATTFDIRQSFAGFGDMRWTGCPTPWVFLRDIAPSRSFGLLTWGLPLKIFHLFSRQALLRGANLFTTGIVWRGRFIGGMHVEDEPVRHRVLDLMGDMRLAGLPIIGHVTGYCPRHDLNHAFVCRIMDDTSAWEIVAAPKREAEIVDLKRFGPHRSRAEA